MSRQLMLANLRNDTGLLDQVDGLLENLASAWAQIGDNANGQTATPQPMAAAQ